MTRQEFLKQWGLPSYMTDTQDILMTIASNLSDMQDGGMVNGDGYDKCNNLKSFIFDYKQVLRSETAKPHTHDV